MVVLTSLLLATVLLLEVTGGAYGVLLVAIGLVVEQDQTTSRPDFFHSGT